MNKHKYPAYRKPREVSYSKSYKLLQSVGEFKLKEMFNKAGMYIVARQLSDLIGYEISPYVVRHVRKRYNLGVSDEKTNL